MITRESIQQVLSRADIVEVIGHFIKLRKRGANYQANCPFHNEKTPSFNVNPARGIYKCFGCGKGGDVVSFVEEYEKFSFTEAIRWLANYYQVELVETETSEAYKEQQHAEESLRIVNDFATQYFEGILHNNEDGKIIGGSYFMQRGFRENIIQLFRLGYCLDMKDAFATHALSQGYSLDILEKAGLVKVRDGKPYDNYRGRVMFPIFSATGKIVGFGARILKKNDQAPKYINTPENELYVKSKILYGLYQSRQSINKLDECFLVEGYTDVISLHQAGVTNVVASSGTSLTEGQLKLIGNITKNLTILYDGDAAGVKAALRGLDMALSESFNVKLVLLPDGEDPDSFVQKSGENEFREYVAKNKRDVIGFRLEVGMKEVGADPVKKSKLINEIAETIAKINKVEDFSLQQHYIHESAVQLHVEEEGLISLVNKFIRDNVQQQERNKQHVETKSSQADEVIKEIEEEAEEDVAAQNDIQKEEWQLIKLLIAYGHKPFKQYNTVAEAIQQTIDLDVFENKLAHKIAVNYYNYWQEHKTLPPLQYFSSHPDTEIKLKVADLLTNDVEPSHNWMEMYKIEIAYGENNYEDEVSSSLAFFELKYIRKMLLENMKNMEKETDGNKVLAMMKTHKTLKSREKDLLQIAIMK